MSEEFRNNQDENLEENGSVYHYNYINSESGNFGKSPKHDKDLRKMMKRAAAIALAVALVGGSFGAGSYVSTHYGAVAQAVNADFISSAIRSRIFFTFSVSFCWFSSSFTELSLYPIQCQIARIGLVKPKNS